MARMAFANKTYFSCIAVGLGLGLVVMQTLGTNVVAFHDSKNIEEGLVKFVNLL